MAILGSFPKLVVPFEGVPLVMMIVLGLYLYFGVPLSRKIAIRTRKGPSLYFVAGTE